MASLHSVCMWYTFRFSVCSHFFSPFQRYVALYDYQAADDDEASFAEGDTARDVEVIDDGWINATIERTGQRGMVPSNYFEVMS